MISLLPIALSPVILYVADVIDNTESTNQEK